MLYKQQVTAGRRITVSGVNFAPGDIIPENILTDIPPFRIASMKRSGILREVYNAVAEEAEILAGLHEDASGEPYLGENKPDTDAADAEAEAEELAGLNEDASGETVEEAEAEDTEAEAEELAGLNEDASGDPYLPQGDLAEGAAEGEMCPECGAGPFVRLAQHISAKHEES